MTGTGAKLTHGQALAVVWLMIVLFTANFAALSFLQYYAFETGAADLGNMNQAAWYTLHKGYPADTYAGRVITRFGGHVEPIFYLLAVPYALHQRPETLLFLQAALVALGALAAYMLARDIFDSEAAGLSFALAYLLCPSLQAATLTEFHPVALAAPFLLFAFYYLRSGSYGRFVIFATLTMSTKEDMSLLVTMLGLLALFLSLRHREARRVGVAAIVGGVAWFILTVYVIIPHFSTSGSNILFERYTEVGGSPQGLFKTLISNPLAVVGRLLAPEKLRYLAGLLASAGFLTLAAPWTLLLAAPSLGINMLSNYPPMYSGLSHYSAPVVPFIIIGAIYGAQSIQSLLTRLRLNCRQALLVILGWLLLSAGIYQVANGFTPLSLLYRIPQVTEHHQLISRFTEQIPPDAVVSVQPPLHPHLSSRAAIYPFPVVNDASYILLDVTARPTMHPNDLKDTVARLMGVEGFGILDAVDGYILLKRGSGQQDLPESFYSAFHTSTPRPQYHAVVDFGPLRLLGYDIEDVDEGRQPWTRTRFYFQITAIVPDDLRIYPFYLDDTGRVIEDTRERPMVATLWYPPSQWQIGETIVIQTLPWFLGDHFRLAIGVGKGGDWDNRTARLPAQLVETAVPLRCLDDGTAVELGRFRRLLTILRLSQLPMSRPRVRVDTRFGDEIKLLGYDLQAEEIAPGQVVRLTLYWRALARPRADYHTFAHIYDRTGAIAAQSDGLTGGDHPTSWWFPGQVITETYTITIPPSASGDLAPEIVVGLYRLETGTRLPIIGHNGRIQGDAIHIAVGQRP